MLWVYSHYKLCLLLQCGDVNTHGFVYQYTKVLHHALPIEEVIRCYEKIPAQCPKPWKLVRSVDYITYGDYLMETFDLDK